MFFLFKNEENEENLINRCDLRYYSSNISNWNCCDRLWSACLSDYVCIFHIQMTIGANIWNSAHYCQLLNHTQLHVYLPFVTIPISFVIRWKPDSQQSWLSVKQLFLNKVLNNLKNPNKSKIYSLHLVFVLQKLIWSYGIFIVPAMNVPCQYQ